MMFHYFTPWFYLYLIQVHVMFCHESWDTDSGESTIEDKSATYVSWFYDAFLKEIQDAWFWTQFVFIYFILHHFNASTITYHFFWTMKYLRVRWNSILRSCTSLILQTPYGSFNYYTYPLRRIIMNGYVIFIISCPSTCKFFLQFWVTILSCYPLTIIFSSNNSIYLIYAFRILCCKYVTLWSILLWPWRRLRRKPMS
jgi:hypothetical protein